METEGTKGGETEGGDRDRGKDMNKGDRRWRQGTEGGETEGRTGTD